jgi:hypothetical protein
MRAAGTYTSLVCGGLGGIASDRIARGLIYVAHAPDWLVYLASYAAFLVADAVFFFIILWIVSTTIRLVTRIVTRPRSPL